MDRSQQEKLMQRYLLGDLSEDEQTALEFEFFTDQEKFEQVWAVENEMIDSYVRDRLPRKEFELFERNYLQSPQHQARVKVARNLLRLADEAETKAAEVTGQRSSETAWDWGAKWLALLKGPFLLPVAAMAGIIFLLMLGTIWLWSQRAQMQNQMAQAQAQSEVQQQRERELEQRTHTLEAQITAQQEANEQTSAELEKLRAEQRQLAAAQAARQIAQVTNFELVDGGVRGNGTVQQLNLSSDSTQVRFRLKVEAGVSQTYEVRIRAVGGSEVWRRASIRGMRSGSQAVITILVPSSTLASDDFILTLAGTTTAGESDELNRYLFRVNRR